MLRSDRGGEYPSSVTSSRHTLGVMPTNSLETWTVASTIINLALTVVMIVAVFKAPQFAVKSQRRLDTEAENRARKHSLFRTLMATRMERASTDHVKALHMIDIEFHGVMEGESLVQAREDKKVVDAWREYHASLDWGLPDNPLRAAKEVESTKKFVDMLFLMSQSLGYSFTRTEIEGVIYRPIAHEASARDWNDIRIGLADLLSNKGELRVMSVWPEDSLKDQKKLHTALIECLKGKAALSVRVDPQAVPESPD